MNKKQAHLLNVPAISDQEHKGDDGSANPFQKQGEERGGGVVCRRESLQG